MSGANDDATARKIKNCLIFLGYSNPIFIFDSSSAYFHPTGTSNIIATTYQTAPASSVTHSSYSNVVPS